VGNIKYFNNIKDLPRLTEVGWAMVKCPDDILSIINRCYKQLVEKQPRFDVVHSKAGIKAQLFDINQHFSKEGKEILEGLKPIHEEWCNQPLESSMIWGVRSYLEGSVLPIHTDNLQTHHVASTIMIDSDQDEDWALQVQGHDFNVVDIYQKKGGMVMYESGKCKHARREPFKGRFYRNLYVHYKLKNFKYK